MRLQMREDFVRGAVVSWTRRETKERERRQRSGGVYKEGEGASEVGDEHGNVWEKEESDRSGQLRRAPGPCGP